MVATESKYRQTRKKLAELDELVVATESDDAGDDDLRDVQLAGLRSQIDDLREEINEYEKRILAAASSGSDVTPGSSALTRRGCATPDLDTPGRESDPLDGVPG